MPAATFRPSGIVDLDKQSRARWSPATTQIAPHATWTPIEFDFDPTLADPDHFDAQSESVPVSDVVFLLPGEMIQIQAWWDAGLGAGAVADLLAAAHATYVSVHKIS